MATNVVTYCQRDVPISGDGQQKDATRRLVLTDDLHLRRQHLELIVILI
jgi:hypothetical protein